MTVSSDHGPLAYSYVRMSTDIQLKGHSKQRQLEISQEYAKAHGLKLADESRLEDIGVSAFKGANIKDGALGQFLAAAENGKVPKGSYLLVESLDRVSRQEIKQSVGLLLRIIGAGITLVTLQDKRVYDEHSGMEDLIISLTILSRAHEESQLKSQRVGAAWANKRANAHQRKLTKWCPAWLKLSNDRRQYEIIPHRAAVVRSIFEDTVAGIGGLAITKRLNERKIPVMGRSKGWHQSYIAKILASRAVIGEFQPCKTSTAGERRPDGPPIKSYFPAIIDEELFYRAQKARSERWVSGRGRKGKFLTNVFSGLATCAYCQSKMMLQNKGSSPKGGLFLVCSAAQRGLACLTTSWRYDHFETSFLAFVDQLDLPALITNENSRKKELEDELQARQGEQLALRVEMEKVYQLLQISPIEFLSEKFITLQKRETEIIARINDVEAQKSRLETSEDEFRQSKEEVKSLIARLQTPGDNDLYKLRSQVAARIKGLIQTLQVAPAGSAPKVAKTIEFLETIEDDPAYKAQVIEQMKIGMDQRYFLVGFKNGDVLAVYPKRDDPLQFEHRLEAGKTELFPNLKPRTFWETTDGSVFTDSKSNE
jgi:DNA invertase Pin-like site-specific DNA recombinase